MPPAVSSETPTTFPDRFNLADYFLFERLREGLGSKIAVRFGVRTYTYDDVARRSRAFAAALEEAGVRRGERVLIVLPDTAAVRLGLLRHAGAGRVVAMGNPDAPIESLAYLVEYTRATAVVTIPRVAQALRERVGTSTAGHDLRRVWCTPEVLALSGAEDPAGPCHMDDGMFRCLARDLAGIDPVRAPTLTHRDEPAIWLFTSGSTGEPKANVHSHRDFAFNTEVYAKRTVGYAAGDVTVSVPRLFFGYATGTNLMFPFAVGATVGLFSERPTAESIAGAHRDVPADGRDERADDDRQAARARRGAARGGRQGARPFERALLALGGRGAARAAAPALARALRQRRLRRHRLGRDVPHLRVATAPAT